MRRLNGTLAAAITLASAASAVATEIPARPERLNFPPLNFNVPNAAAMRVKLANGVPCYIAEDRMLPLVTVQVLLRGGQYLEPAGKEGLAELTGTVWRTGGAGKLEAKALDEELDFLAASLTASVRGVSGTVSLNLLSKDIDRGLSLLMDVLREPRFDEVRLAKAKEDMLSEMKRRNDETEAIEGRELDRLIYGTGYWLNRLATKASVDGITRDDLIAFHKRLANPANFVLAVAGDFDRAAMIAKLNATLGAWKASGPAVPQVPQPSESAKPGVYLVNKPDVNQGRVSIGHIGVKRPLADEFALSVANDILGGGGFTAWMMSRVRSDEGLAYSAYSRYSIGDVYPGVFRAFFQSKSSTCAQAAKLTTDLIAKIRTGTVTEKELVTSKNSFTETLPRTFESKLKTVGRFAQDELVGLSHDYWKNYRERVGAVTAADVAKAATAHIKPDQLIILVVGNIEEILKGHPDHPEARFEKLGPIVRLPLLDPMTLRPIEK
ncbi:MAG: insulinase family protein [Acidobacteriia bacterium]|nr:insulinase family protein [Terriglobia bacterium]